MNNSTLSSMDESGMSKANSGSSTTTLLSNLNETINSEPDLNATGELKHSNYVKSLASLILDQLNTQDMNAILDSQKQTIQRLDQTNKNVTKFNQTSMETYAKFALKDFQSHINTLNTMRQDLEFIFKKIRAIKVKLQAKYSNEFNRVVNERKQKRGEESEEEQEDREGDKPSETNVDLGGKSRSISNQSSNSIASLAAAMPNVVIENTREGFTGNELISKFIQDEEEENEDDDEADKSVETNKESGDNNEDSIENIPEPDENQDHSQSEPNAQPETE